MRTPYRVAFTALAAGALCFLEGSPAIAAAGGSQVYTFIQDGYAEGATVTGSFTGADLDGNGILVHFPDGNGPPIEHLELTAWSMRFSGNTLSPAFDLTLEDLFGFIFEIETEGLGDDPAFEPTLNQDLREGIGAIGPEHFYTTGLGPNNVIGGYVGGPINMPSNYQVHAVDSSPALLAVTRVPEPSSFGMLAATLLLASLVCRAHR